MKLIVIQKKNKSYVLLYTFSLVNKNHRYNIKYNNESVVVMVSSHLCRGHLGCGQLGHGHLGPEHLGRSHLGPCI